MASNEELHNDLDDLVREVIEENPPEEQGIRPEWINHEGWHRKENILHALINRIRLCLTYRKIIPI